MQNRIVLAKTINSIDMDIYIDKYGNALVEEIWNTNLTCGTEGYKVFSNLNNSNITNFIVKDDKDIEYSYIGKWNINKTFNEKAYKNGLIILMEILNYVGV